MRLAIFGATGRVGGEIVRLALQDGYDVKALVRIPTKLYENEHLTIIKGNVLHNNDVEKTIDDADMVISTLGVCHTTTLSEGMPHIISSMKKHHIKRIVTIGTAGILNSRREPGKFRFQTNESRQKKTFAAEEHAKAFQMLKESDLEWTIICPTYLPDGEATGIYRIEKNQLPLNGEKITVGDTAKFAYEECFKKQFLQIRVGLAY
ncbi:NAD(P)-dependent oxidoreductase [Rummeliibacillus suwonensis]|jgi:putative NADH-flavin reductase|uniref:NAD(P)-dependent oxidoreductase n=1 Tax=Rummeliibacillus suwonensis TaxID=1306154 RepID=UPI0011B59FF2|nr:SDR family oxidoreductase [Rummeliibacillus suwonensis]MBO2536843.1 SDR family oxidoreductase [Rummeliibacillus suwonensis]